MKKIIACLILAISIHSYSQSVRIDSLKKVIKNTKSDTIKINTLCLLSRESADFDLNDSKTYAFKALQIAIKINKKRLIANSYHRIGSAYFYSGILDSALIYNKKALKIREVLKIKKDLGASYNNLGNLYTELANYKEALFYHQKTIEVDQFYNNKYNLGGSLGDMGITYQKLGDFKNAIKCYLQSLLIAQELKDDRGICFNNINLGVLYHLNIDKINAYKSYKNAIFHAKKLDIKGVESRTLNNLGQLYIEFNDSENKSIKPYSTKFQKAINAVKAGLNLAKTTKDEGQISECYSALGNIYFKKFKETKNKNDLSLSKQYLDSSLNLKIKIKDDILLPVTLNFIGNVHFAEGNFEKAKSFYLKSLKSFTNDGNYDNKINCLYNLFELSKKQLKIAEALLYFQEYVKLKDSVYNIDSQKNILKQSLTYDFEKKSIKDSIANANQKIIASAKLSKEKNQKLAFGSFALLALAGVGFTYFLYRQKRKTNYQLTEINDKIYRQNNTLKTLNTELITSEEKLQKSNNSKEQLISMMSHDLLNPITAITNYNQQIISRKNNSDELLQAFKTVDAAIQPMHGLLDNLLHWTAIQKDGINSKLKNQDVNNVIKEIICIYRLQAQLKFIKLIDSLDNNFIHATDKSILALILRNLLNNAIKYSGNETEIQIISNTAQKTITIKDQGFGMTDEMITYLNAKQVDKIESRGTGLGLKLCYEFAEAISAEIVFEKNEIGTTVNLKL